MQIIKVSEFVLLIKLLFVFAMASLHGAILVRFSPVNQIMNDIVLSAKNIQGVNGFDRQIASLVRAGVEGVDRFLRGELSVSEPTRSWREEDGVIYLSVKSDGTTGPEWERWYDENGYSLSDEARFILNSPDFKPTKSGTVTEVAVLKGMLFENNGRITKNIRAEADKRKLSKPNAEVICLIRKNFSDKEMDDMGLWWIIAMHEPINDSGGGPHLLSAYRLGDGRWLGACHGRPDRRWDRDDGFAFAVSQVGPQN